MSGPYFFAAVITVLSLISIPALAYVDHGSAHFIYQLTVALLVGAAITLKMYFKSIKQLMVKIFCKDMDAKSKQQESDQKTTDQNNS